MSKISEYVVSFILPTVLGLGLVGCSTLIPDTEADKLARVEAIAKLSAFCACSEDVTARPINRSNWINALGGLQVMIEANEWDAATLGAALSKAGVAEMIGEDGKLILMGGVLLFDAFDNTTTAIGKNEYVKAVTRGAYEGIDLALNSSLPSNTNRKSLTEKSKSTRPRR